MSKNELKLELDKRCDEFRCKCEKRPKDITATKETNNPSKGYTRHTHKLPGDRPFTLFNVKYNNEFAPGGPYKVTEVLEVAVYYDGEDRPFVIEVKTQGGTKYYTNNSPVTRKDVTNWGDNTSWTQENSLGNSPQRLNERLENLSCNYANSVSVDIFKKITRSTYYCKNKVNVIGHKFSGVNDIYEFKYNTQGNKPFKVHSFQYNGKDIEIPIPSDEVQEISTFYWKHNFGKPLVVKVTRKNGEIDYHFSHGRVGEQWDKRDESKIGKLNNAIVEHNCLRNRTTMINLSKNGDEEYCCTEKCPNKRIKVVSQQSNAFPGFTVYEHISNDGLPLIMGSIIRGGEKQKGIRYPIRYTYKVTVYYQNTCTNEPLFLEILYMNDNGHRDYKWYQRITRNGWNDLSNQIPDTDTEIYNSLRDNFKTVATVLGTDCNPNKLPEDNTNFPGKEPEPKTGVLSPENMFEELKKLTTGTEFIPPIGPEDEEAEEKKIEEDKQKASTKEEKYIPPDQRKWDNLQPNPRKSTYPATVKQLEAIKQKLAATPTPLPLPVRALPPSVINIKEDIPPGQKAESYTYPSGGQVKLTKEENPPGFLKFTHTKNGGGSFTVEKVIYGQNNYSKDYKMELKIPEHEGIQHIAVWYWNNDPSLNNPLLVEVKMRDGNFIYSSNKGGSGNSIEWSPAGTNQLQGEKLETQLDDLNCLLNQAVTMDLSSGTTGYYCCKNHGGSKVGVSSENITITSSSTISSDHQNSISYHKHSIRGKGMLAKIKYYLYKDNYKKNRKRIVANGLTFPIPGPVDVYVFYCQQDPALIYVKKSDGSNQGTNKWYKRQNQGNHNGDWIEAGLNSLTPYIIKNDCNNWNQVKNILNELGCDTGNCVQTPGSNRRVGSLHVTSTVTDPKVTIKLEYKPDIRSLSSILYPDVESNKTIQVAESPYQTDFLKYKHEDKDNPGKEFTLKAVEDDKKTNILNGQSVKSVTSVSAYYWQHKTDSALLVEVEDSSRNKTYYRNTKGGIWSEYHSITTPGQGPTQAELELFNCEINDVVQIDVSEISNYCHYGHSVSKKVKVTPVSNASNLGNYTAYEHTPNTSGKFDISAFKKYYDHMTLKDLNQHIPIKGVEKVIVYACSQGFYDPLLVYIHSDDQRISDLKWFKKPDRDNSPWQTVSSSLTDDSDAQDIVDFLDTLESECKPPEVTIDIYQRGYQTSKSFFYEDAKSKPCKQNISVIPKSNPLGVNNFTEYIHTISGRNSYFTVHGFNYDKDNAMRFETPTNYVTSVSVFYWSPLEAPSKMRENRGRPLLVKVLTMEPSTRKSSERWYENNGPINNLSWKSSSLEKDQLETKLKFLNCKLNNAVFIDISKTGKTYDSCDENSEHEEDKVIVIKDGISTTKLHHYQVYRHTLNNGGTKFHIVDFKNAESTLNGIFDLPILDVTEVKVYMCEKDRKALLVYINTGDSTKQKRYRNEKSATNTGQWVPVDELSNANVPEDSHKEILDLFNGLESECKPSIQGRTDQLTGELALGGSTLAGYVSSGTLAGAGGLTGLGWWAFKRSKGDPWVRQI